jgi:GGDEF domain-containing protein
MSLHNRISSQASQAVRLLKLDALPTTEDLRFLVSEARRLKRPVEVPFKRDRTTPEFVIRVTLPTGQGSPTWTFYRSEGGGLLWNKDSGDVMVIQNKMKMDSALTTTAQYAPQPQYYEEPVEPERPYILTDNTLDPVEAQYYDQQPVETQYEEAPPLEAPLFDAPSFETASFDVPFSESAPSPPGPIPFMMGAADGSQRSSGPGPGFPVAAGNQPASAPNLFTNWMPEAKPALPPPIELDPSVNSEIEVALLDPNTGLTHFRAFTFFLMREFARFKRFNVALSALAFDFVESASKAPTQLSPSTSAAIVNQLDSMCSGVHFATRMDSGDFIVLLCNTDAAESVKCADALLDSLSRDESLRDLFGETISLAIGLATIPNSCDTPGLLLAAAMKAKQMARDSSRPHRHFS